MNFKLFVLVVIFVSHSSQVHSESPQVRYWNSFKDANFTTCVDGKKQSPIDIPEKNIEAKFEAFKFMNYDDKLKTAKLANNGHTAKLTYTADKDKDPSMSGGGLGAKYTFAQLHFHWGGNNSQGSEHTFAGKKYPMELHLVHYKSSLGDDLSQALANGKGAQDTLAVLGIMYKIQDTDNAALNPIIDGLAQIKKQGQYTNIKTFALGTLLPANKNTFYRYNGSLTTPKCNQVVIWTVFKEPVGISASQMDKFRKLTYNDTKAIVPLIDNYRVVQRINERKIYDYNYKSGTEKFGVNILTFFGLILTKVILF